MKKQNLIIILALAILILLGGVAYFKMFKTSIDNTLNTNEIVDNKKEINTTDWELFTDEVLGVNYMSSPDYCDHGVVHMNIPNSSKVGCSEDGVIEYTTLLPIPEYEQYFELLKNNKNFTLEEIANAIYEANLNNKNPNKPKGSLITLLEKINLNGSEAYQFTVDWSYSKVHYEGGNWVYSGEYLLDSPTRYTYVVNAIKSKLLEIKNDSKDNEIADKILETWKFLD